MCIECTLNTCRCAVRLVVAAGLFLDERVEDLEKVNRVNFMGVVYTLKAGLPGLIQRKSGCVLMIASLMAMYGKQDSLLDGKSCDAMPLPPQMLTETWLFAAGFCSSAYVAPKAAILSLTNALRLEVWITVAIPTSSLAMSTLERLSYDVAQHAPPDTR